MIDLQNDGHEPVRIPGVFTMKGEDWREIAAQRLVEQYRIDLSNAERCNRWVECHSSYRDASAYAKDMIDDMGLEVAAQYLTDCQLQGWVVIFRRKR